MSKAIEWFAGTSSENAAKKERARQTFLGAKAIDEMEGAQERTRSAQLAQLGIFGGLGQADTFGAAGGAGGAGTGTLGGLFQDPKGMGASAKEIIKAGGGRKEDYIGDSGIFNDKKYRRLSDDAKGEIIEASASREGIVNPEAFSQYVQGTVPFQMQSFRTAEANQLLNEEGPAYDKLYNSTIGQIFEGAAELRRESLREIKNNLAKGGTARRTAFAEATKINAIEAAAALRTRETWQANLELFRTVRENAEAVRVSNQNFVDTLPVVGAQYVNTMNGLSTVMSTQVLPTTADISQQAYQNVASIEAQKNAWIGKTIGMGASIVGGALIGAAGGAYSAAGAGTSMSTGAISGATTGAAMGAQLYGSYSGQQGGGTYQQGTDVLRSLTSEFNKPSVGKTGLLGGPESDYLGNEVSSAISPEGYADFSNLREQHGVPR